MQSPERGWNRSDGEGRSLRGQETSFAPQPHPQPSHPTHPPNTHTHTRIRTYARTRQHLPDSSQMFILFPHIIPSNYRTRPGEWGGGGGEEEEERKYRSRYTSRRPDLVDTENCFLWWNSWPIDGRWHCFVVVFVVVVLRERVSPQTDR